MIFNFMVGGILLTRLGNDGFMCSWNSEVILLQSGGGGRYRYGTVLLCYRVRKNKRVIPTIWMDRMIDF